MLELQPVHSRSSNYRSRSLGLPAALFLVLSVCSRRQREFEEQERERKREEKVRKREQKQKEREERRNMRKLQREEQKRLQEKIALEERKLLLAQRNLQSIRLIAELLSRAKVSA